MKKEWTPPGNLAPAWAINNRTQNPSYIQSLVESMEKHGYLSDYPIVVYEAENITSIETDKPYVISCGHHRHAAALQACIAQVFVEIHDGTEEDWIETMAMDNFRFDVAENPEIGMAFTQKEKRAACTQLLLLPKFLKKTNTVLADLWHTAETNVRRWRKEVETLIGEDHPNLRIWGIPQPRIQALQAIIAKRTRENSKGEKIRVRGEGKKNLISSTSSDLMHNHQYGIMKRKKHSADVPTENKNERDIPLVYAIQVSDKDVKIGISTTHRLKGRYEQARTWCRNPKLLGVMLVDRHDTVENNELLAKKEEGRIHAYFSAERELVYFSQELKDFIEREMVPGEQYLEDL